MKKEYLQRHQAPGIAAETRQKEKLAKIFWSLALKTEIVDIYTITT